MGILIEIPVTIQIRSVVPKETQKGIKPGETYSAIAQQYNGTPYWKVKFDHNGMPCYAWTVPEDMKTSHLTTCVIVPPKEEIEDIEVIEPQIIN